jgi:hypothetical protein
MGEPSKGSGGAVGDDELWGFVTKQFPNATLERVGDQYVVATIHGVGATPLDAAQKALGDMGRIFTHGRKFTTLLSEIKNELSSPGMTRKRHDSLMTLIGEAENALNDGVLANTVHWLLRAGYTKELTDLSRRVTTRLGMAAAELAAADKAGTAHARARQKGAKRFSGANDPTLTHGERLAMWRKGV